VFLRFLSDRTDVSDQIRDGVAQPAGIHGSTNEVALPHVTARRDRTEDSTDPLRLQTVPLLRKTLRRKTGTA
jgi:hypothetical protein